MQPSDQVPAQQQLEQELQRKRAKLLKALEQGEKIQNLTAAPEWQFFIEWIEASKNILDRDIHSVRFINDHSGYIYNLGKFNAYDDIIKGIEAFQRAFDKASKQRIELDKEFDAIRESNG